ncbi:hypothetical protein [Streptomyces sp. NPDC047985]|uniref:hypothetical protein n=1 Tax=unclassified Streptomyces TaxID=2593676 RepID=UPI003422DC75
MPVAIGFHHGHHFGGTCRIAQPSRVGSDRREIDPSFRERRFFVNPVRATDDLAAVGRVRTAPLHAIVLPMNPPMPGWVVE